MSSVDARPRAREARLIEDATTLANPGWLPANTGFEGLDDLAAEHRRILGGRGALASERRELLEGFEAEDAAHQDALRAGFRRGGGGELPEVTAPEDRRVAVASVVEREQAANDALDEFLAEAVELIEERADAWMATLAEATAGAEAARAEAARLLAEAAAEEQKMLILQGWVKRNAGLDPRPSFRLNQTRFYPWAAMAVDYRPVEPQMESASLPSSFIPTIHNVPSGPAWDDEAVARRIYGPGGRPDPEDTNPEQEDES